MSLPQFFRFNDKGGTVWANVALISSIKLVKSDTGQLATIQCGPELYHVHANEIDRLTKLLDQIEWGPPAD